MQRLKLTIPVGSVSEHLTDFPVLVKLPSAASESLTFTDSAGDSLQSAPLGLPDEGTVWVRLPNVYPATETVFFAEPDPKGTAISNFDDVFPTNYRFVLSRKGIWESVIDRDAGDSSELTVESWVCVDESRAERMQVIASQWPLADRVTEFATYDAGNTDGLETKGYFGAMCDGRYVYFSPQCNTTGRHGNALRYDTHGDFHNSASWSGYDAGHTSNLETQGYYGVACTDRYVYYVPRQNRFGEKHTTVLRYDAGNGDFGDSSAWSAFDIGSKRSSQGCAFDGRYLYLVPGYANDDDSGVVIRYDSTAPFQSPESYESYDASQTGGLACHCYDGAVFDGRHIYFAPLTDTGNMLRYDTRQLFHDQLAWESCDIRNATDPAIAMCVGAVFDGRYVYYVPYGDNTVVVRYDTEAPFDHHHSWESRDVAGTSGLACRGFDGANFDGRYVYFVPFYDGALNGTGFHCQMLRYDTSRGFQDSASWEAADGAVLAPPNPGGFNGGSFDGRFLYFAPWRKDGGPDDPTGDGSIFPHGHVLRYDTAGSGARFQLKYMDCGHNGGLGASLPGPTFTVNTDRGSVSVRGHCNPGPGWHHLAGVYDGVEACLYIDGQLVGKESGNGDALPSEAAVLVGELEEGCSHLAGEVTHLTIADCPRSDAWIRAAADNLTAPEKFVQIIEEG